MAIPLAMPNGGNAMAAQGAVQSANPRALLQQQVGSTGPTAEQQSAGIADQLKQVVAIANAIAQDNPQVAEEMNAIQQLAVRAVVKTQEQSAQPPPASATPFGGA